MTTRLRERSALAVVTRPVDAPSVPSLELALRPVAALVPVRPEAVRAARLAAVSARTVVVGVGQASGSRLRGPVTGTVERSMAVALAAPDRFVTARTLAFLVGRRHDVVLRVHGDGSLEPLDADAVIDTADGSQQLVVGPLTLYS